MRDVFDVWKVVRPSYHRLGSISNLAIYESTSRSNVTVSNCTRYLYAYVVEASGGFVRSVGRDTIGGKVSLLGKRCIPWKENYDDDESLSS